MYIYINILAVKPQTMYISLVKQDAAMARYFDQQSAQLSKVRRCNIPSICGEWPFRSLRAHHLSSDHMKNLKDRVLKLLLDL